ncbi:MULTISPECIES: hypothetical protein [unclassified Caballeronia]|uniref:hypothetical protein n=1 Tax=unclassified Caballeronia TaxID=2646786 RepID=UPI00202831D6|nr:MULTISPECIES: hypothetical protein [unclassified Caballeronia]
MPDRPSESPTESKLYARPLGSSAGSCSAHGGRNDAVSASPRYRRHSKILTTLIDQLDAYLANPACLPSLNSASGHDRQQRLDRRTACVQLLRAHVKYLDLISVRVGIPQRDGSFMSLTLPFLAKQAGIGLRRAERAMRDLQQPDSCRHGSGA